MEDKVMSHITKGLLVSLVLILISIAGYYGGLDEKSWFRWISTLVMVAGIIWGCIYYANQLDGRVTYGNIFAHGFKMTAVITLITILYTILAFTVIYPEMKDRAIGLARQQMEEKGTLTDTQIDQAVELTKKFFLPFLVGGILLMSLIFGAIASAIGASLAKKKPFNPLDQINR
ncbi:MAG TPA: DUF4199 domain-containing protein [Chitinophagaceae bacterium]|nr:DUF4199 domain-containing protein [Chitinophagaceae bacterium]